MIYVVGSRAFRPRLPEYLRRARNGDAVVLVVHDRPVALLRAVRTGDKCTLVASREVRDDLHLAIQKARSCCFVVTRYGRASALLEAPPAGSEVLEEAS